MYTVCIVEDDAMLAEIYHTLLQSAGFKSFVANDGQAGIELVGQVQPDLVLLDIMLPQLSGDEVLRQIRSNDWGKETKVIMLTNISESEAPDGLNELGFSRYIVKANLVSNTLPQICTEVITDPATPQTSA
jgi:DNA-binding response OmpR family regulator